MKNLLIALCLIAVIGIGAYIGCDGASARMGVAKNKVIKQIDKVLGELNVKREKVRQTYDKVQDAYVKLREQRIEAKVLAERFDDEIKALKADQAANRKNLEKLKSLMTQAQESSDGTVEKNGRTVSTAQLTSHAEAIMKNMGRNKEKLAHKVKMQGIFQKNLTMLEANEKTSKTQLADLKEDIDEIDSKKDMLDSMKTDAGLLTGEGTSINDEFEKLSKEVDDLKLKVDTQVAVEEAKLEQRIDEIQSAPENIDDLFKDDVDPEGTMSDMDKWLTEEGE